MKTFIFTVLLLISMGTLFAQDTIFNLDVLSATLNGKQTMQELTKKRLISFALLSSDKEKSKLTAWVDGNIAMDGTLDFISKKRHIATKDKLEGYEANYVWNTFDDDGKLVKFGVAFHIIVNPSKDDSFVLEVRRGSDIQVYGGFLSILSNQ